MADEQIEGLPQGATVRPLSGERHEEIEGLPVGATTRPLAKKPPTEKQVSLPGGTPTLQQAVTSGKTPYEPPTSFEEARAPQLEMPVPTPLGSFDANAMGRGLKAFSTGLKNFAGGVLESGLPTSPYEAAVSGVKQAGQAVGEDIGRKEAGRSAPYRAIAGIAPALAPGLDPGAMEREADVGNAPGVLGQAAVPLSLTMAGEALGRGGPEAQAKLEARRVASGPEEIGKALATPPGKGGARAAAMKEDLSVATKDLAAIEKETPAKVTAILKRGKGAENFHELAEKIDARQEKMWDEGHQPGIDRHAEAMIDHEKVRAAGQGAMTPEAREAAPAEAQAADTWLQGIAKERNLKSTDALIREINADLKGKDVGTRYGPLGIRVRQAVVQALRDEVENVLTTSGEKGVKAVNRRWGALENIKGRLAERAVQEANAEAKGGVLPDWVHLYSFLHPDAGLSVGAGVAVGKMLRPSASSRLTKGMRQLGRTDLEAPYETPPPSDWRKGVETNPARLLPAPAHQIPIPEEPAIPARGGVEAKRMVFRDPASGRMQRGYTGEPATEPMQGRVADYWSGDQGPVQGEYVPPEKAAQAISHEPIGKVKAKRGAKDRGVVGGSVEEQAAEISRKAPTREERRATPRDTGGPDFMRTTLLNTLRKQLETLPEGRDRDIVQSQYDDALAHPFERHEGEADINRIKEKGKPTKTRAEAEKNVEARKAGSAAKFKKGTITDDDVKTLRAQLDKTKSIKKTRELIREFFKAKKGDTIQ